jgi:hypothetical protein
LRYRDQLSRSVDSIGPATPSQEGLHIDLTSSLDHTPDASNQAGVNTSLFVEMGSGGHIESSDDGSALSSDVINSRREAARRRLEGVDAPRKATGDGEVGENANLKSPTRRASEVFAFLDFPKEDPDSSFEIGALEEYSDEGKCLFGPVQSAQPLADVGEGDRISRLELDLGQPLVLSTSLLSANTSPLKKPLGPRGTPSAMSRLDDARKPGQILSRIPRHTSLKHSRANTSADTSSVPLTGATFESDSFASQNTTDRSIYRGIYSYLRDATSNPANSGIATSKAPSSSPNTIQETPAGDGANPFLATPINMDKDLPSTPPSELEIELSPHSPAFRTPKRDVGTFKPLPLFSPISPLDAGMAAQIPRTPGTPSPSKRPYKSIVKDRVAEWEKEKPLNIEQERIQRQISTRGSSIPRSLSVKGNDTLSRGTSRPSNFDTSKSRGLGDGRAFNAANKPIMLEESKNSKPKFYPGRRDSKIMSPIKRTGGDASINPVKGVDSTQLYPFSDDCEHR